IGARGDQVACEIETLAEYLLRVGTDVRCGETGRIGRAVDGADRRSRDEGWANAEFVEGFEDEDMSKPARTTTAERERDARSLRHRRWKLRFRLSGRGNSLAHVRRVRLGSAREQERHEVRERRRRLLLGEKVAGHDPGTFHVARK